jgi:site-specific recombinase XerD
VCVPRQHMLKDYRLRWRPNAFGLLFANAKGQPITSCYVRRDILHPIRERLGIPRGAFHAFRHGLGTALMQAGANARVVQQQLGHADLRMHTGKCAERVQDGLATQATTPQIIHQQLRHFAFDLI